MVADEMEPRVVQSSINFLFTGVLHMKRFSRITFTLAVCALFISLPACNTTKGLGTDIEKAGEGIQGSAERNGAD